MHEDRPPARRPGWQVGVLAAGWLLVAAMAAFATARLAGRTDAGPRLFAAATLTFWILLPAWLVVVVAAVLRARALLVAAVALVALQLVWTGPDLRWWSTESTEPAGTPFTVASANVYVANDQPEAAARVLGELDADVLAVVELTEPVARALERSGALDDHPHRATWANSAIYSRYPLHDARAIDVAGLPMGSATVDLPTGPTTVVAVHTTQPLDGVDRLSRQLVALERLAAEAPGPVILAGDFNATRQHAPFRALLEGDLRSAMLVAGRGWAATWPNLGRLPSFALIDHVVVSEDVVVLDARDVDVPGSDHEAVIATLDAAASR